MATKREKRVLPEITDKMRAIMRRQLMFQPIEPHEQQLIGNLSIKQYRQLERETRKALGCTRSIAWRR
jgi:hypothetical protein